jgi:hypothetical protein
LFQYLLWAEAAGSVTAARTVIMTLGVIGEPEEEMDSIIPIELRDISRRLRLLNELSGAEKIHPYETWQTFKAYGAGSLMIEAMPGQKAVILADLKAVELECPPVE